METMLSKALRDFLKGPLNQLLVNIAGDEGEMWEMELKRFLRKEPCWTLSFDNSWQVEILRLAKKNLRKRLGQEIQVPDLPTAITEELFNKLAALNMRPCFLPDLNQIIPRKLASRFP